MLNFRRKEEDETFTARAPDGVRLYAIGDIHGRFDLLADMMTRIRSDSGDMPHRLIFLGDYVDRGDASGKIIGSLVKLKASRGDGVIFLKGNHEQAMLDFIAAPEDSANWLTWGGAATLESYGVKNIAEREPAGLRDELLARMPDAHFNFLMTLETAHREGDYIFVHAGMRPGVPLESQREQDLLWIREEFFNARPADFARTCIVHGHTPVDGEPDNLNWRINVDTGAVWTGRLTAAVLEGTERRFIST